MEIGYVLAEYKIGKKKCRQYLVPMISNKILGKYGIANLIMYAMFNNNQAAMMFGFWHDNDTIRFLDMMTAYYYSLVEACEKKHYMNSAMGFFPKTDKIEIIKKFTFSRSDWSKDFWIKFMEMLKEKQKEFGEYGTNF